ncbi:MAG TPA: acyl-CoA dehydrogenase family protein, partial [Nakamurella sp.]
MTVTDSRPDIRPDSLSPDSDVTDLTALTVRGIRGAIVLVLARLAATAHEREILRDYAFDDVRALAEAGIALIRIARSEGGAGGSLRDVVDVVIDVARADSNVGQAVRASFLTANQVAGRPDLPHRDRLLAQLRNRDLFAGTGNERSGGPSGSVHTTARREPGGWVINGEKYYSTGGLYASWFGGQARTEDGRIVRFSVPVDRDGVQVLDDFDAIGQRLTASGTTRLTEVRVSDDEVVVAGAEQPDNTWPGSFAQLYLAAVEAGIAARAL